MDSDTSERETQIWFWRLETGEVTSILFHTSTYYNPLLSLSLDVTLDPRDVVVRT